MQEAHAELTQATAIIEQIRAPEEERDLILLRTAIHEDLSVNLRIPLSVINMHLLGLSKEALIEKKYDLWAELLMQEAMATPTLPRRLRDLASDQELLTKTQDQILFEGFCHLSESMEHFDSLATLLKAAFAHKTELPTSVADDVKDLSEVVTVGGKPDFSTWDEARLMQHKTKLRGTGNSCDSFAYCPWVFLSWQVSTVPLHF